MGVNKEADSDKKGKRVLGAAVVNTGEMGRGSSSTACLPALYTQNR